MLRMSRWLEANALKWRRTFRPLVESHFRLLHLPAVDFLSTNCPSKGRTKSMRLGLCLVKRSYILSRRRQHEARHGGENRHDPNGEQCREEARRIDQVPWRSHASLRYWEVFSLQHPLRFELDYFLHHPSGLSNSKQTTPCLSLSIQSPMEYSVTATKVSSQGCTQQPPSNVLALRSSSPGSEHDVHFYLGILPKVVKLIYLSPPTEHSKPQT